MKSPDCNNNRFIIHFARLSEQTRGGQEMKLKGKELDFVRARNAIVSGPLTYRQRIAQLSLLQAKTCRMLTKQPQLQLEVKRRIAETLLDMSISRGCEIPSCRQRLKSLEKLGFTNIEVKAHYHLIYARTALKKGHPQIALNTANKMVLELRHSLSKRRSVLGRELLGHFEQLVNPVGRSRAPWVR